MKKSLFWKTVDKLARVPWWGWLIAFVAFSIINGAIFHQPDHEFKEYMGEPWYWDDGPSNRWTD
jgi:hypothetical protein